MAKRELQDLGYGVHLVPLTRGQFALIDSADVELVRRWNWMANVRSSKAYARRGVGQLSVYMHCEIMGAPDGYDVDHINGDTLDNRRSNLRIVTRAQNLFNQGLRKSNTSGFKGVSKKGERWVAMIRGNGKKLYLGTYDTPEEAHEAYCLAAKEYHGEFARTA